MKNTLESLISINYQPSQLTSKELSNPTEVLSNFFEINELHQIRTNLFELYKGWVNHASDTVEGKKYAEMLFFYQQMINFIDASYLINQHHAEV